MGFIGIAGPIGYYEDLYGKRVGVYEKDEHECYIYKVSKKQQLNTSWQCLVS